MDKTSYIQNYRRFFAILASVLPGLNLMIGVGAFLLWLLADLIEVEWGWGVGVAAIFMVMILVGWIFAGQFIRKWADTKPTGVLVGLCAPFLLIDTILAGMLFEMSVLRQFILTQEQREAGEMVDIGTILAVELGGPLLIALFGAIMWGIAMAFEKMAEGKENQVA